MEICKKLGLGTVQFGLSYGISNNKGQTSPREVRKILNLASFHGIHLLDSASAYGNAEEILGGNDLTNFYLVSKYMPPSEGIEIKRQLENSINRLNHNCLYGYLAHRPLDLLQHPEHWDELNRFKEDGKVKKIGFSLNAPEELEKLLDKGFVPDLIQVPFNYFDRRFEKLLKILKKEGCEIHSRSTFLQGLFFMDTESLDTFFDEVKPEIRKLQESSGSLSGVLLKFVLEKQFIDKVILGVENSAQLEDNLNNLKNDDLISLPELSKEISPQIIKPYQWPKK